MKKVKLIITLIILLFVACIIGFLYSKKYDNSFSYNYVEQIAHEYNITLPQNRANHTYDKESISIDSTSSYIYELNHDETVETRNNINQNHYWHKYCHDDEALLYILSKEHRKYISKYVDIEKSFFAVILNDEILYPAGNNLYLDPIEINRLDEEGIGKPIISELTSETYSSEAEPVNFETWFVLFIFDPISENFVITNH